MGVAYNDYVKRPDQEHDYTQEQIEEIIKCKQDFFYFCKYVRIVHQDLGRIEFIPRDYQIDLFELVLKNRFVIASFCRQSGKCVCDDTMITIRNKHTGLVEEISIGGFYDRIKK